MMEKDPRNLTEEEIGNPSNGNEGAYNINADSDIPGTSHLNDPMDQQDKYQAEIAELKDKYLRQAAEFDNFRRRSARERLELNQTAGKEILVSLLDVLDDCERAQKQLENSEASAVKEGVQLIFNKFRNIMQSKGVKAMETLHTDFNPDLHEAITEIPSPTPALVGKVLDEVQKGYYLNDKIIRFAKVVVGK
jgi:molecular chaperone GrpE